MDDWLPIMPEFTRWHYAVDEFELIHFAAQVRYQAPAHPKDILVDKEVQAYRMQTRLNEISLQRKQILKYRIRKMLANQIAELAELTEQIENAN